MKKIVKDIQYTIKQIIMPFQSLGITISGLIWLKHQDKKQRKQIKRRNNNMVRNDYRISTFITPLEYKILEKANQQITSISVSKKRTDKVAKEYQMLTKKNFLIQKQNQHEYRYTISDKGQKALDHISKPQPHQYFSNKEIVALKFIIFGLIILAIMGVIALYIVENK